MNTSLVVLWILVGWCGTYWPRRWPWPPPPPPNGDPWLQKVVNVVGGVIGGWWFHQTWSDGGAVTGVAAAATAVGAFVGSVILGDVYGLVTRGQKR